MQNKRKKILWLASWYPNKYDPFDGDFIQRHARAAALYDDIHLLFVKQSEQQGKTEVTLQRTGGLTEQIIYLPRKNGAGGKLLNIYQWQQVYCRQLDQIISRERPHCLHVHVPWKAGLLALRAKKRFGLPYYVTEHWGIYNSVVSDNIYKRSFFFRSSTKQIIKRAQALVSVSDYLGQAINQTVVKKRFEVIPNVVDTTLFYPGEKKPGAFTFLHVSNMVPLKNVEGILDAFRAFLQTTGARAQLILVGNKDETFPRIAQQMNLLNHAVFFRGEMPYEGVALEMRKADALVMNSDMENSPCVIGEALCCGLPVIATRVGGIPELVNARNGILIPPNDGASLSAAFSQLMREYDRFDKAGIASFAEKSFGMESIGQQIHRLYN